ncbi:hypothetical protein CTAYLR_002301 [Chrysophaeum taylorii]|uniref:PPIase cyclophilin-type domain-containing protein n=1 Tax=Chrysophaeum taylorii TaxID=2483200 RepID=A0AAD7UN45_9STRA|nr:hypothetical protein CTAYLR_002301 [Chrysophaeum taylorii]
MLARSRKERARDTTETEVGENELLSFPSRGSPVMESLMSLRDHPGVRCVTAAIDWVATAVAHVAATAWRQLSRRQILGVAIAGFLVAGYLLASTAWTAGWNSASDARRREADSEIAAKESAWAEKEALLKKDAESLKQQVDMLGASLVEARGHVAEIEGKSVVSTSLDCSAGATTTAWLAALPEPPRGAPTGGSTAIVECATTAGPLTIAVFSSWAPMGATRFLELVKSQFFSSEVAVHRVFPNWLAFFGISGVPSVTKEWEHRSTIRDDPQWLSGESHFERGMLSFSGTGQPDSRSTILFVMLGSDTAHALGGQSHEVPFGRVVGEASFRTLDAWFSNFHLDQVPDFDKARKQGVSYLKPNFPHLDYITSCAVKAEISSRGD